MRYHKKWGKPCGVLTVFCELVFTARTFQNIHSKFFWVNSPPQPKPSRSLQLNEKQKTNPKPKPSRSLHLNEIQYKRRKTMWRFTFFFWLHFHSQDLPEPYTSIRPKRTPEHITPEWMRYKRGSPCGVLTFFVNWFPQPECSRTHTSMKPNWKKHEKHVAFSVFLTLSPQPEPSRSLQLHERQKTSPQLNPSRSLHLNEIQKKGENLVTF